MRVLIIDVGGMHIKVLLSSESEPRQAFFRLMEQALANRALNRTTLLPAPK